MPADEEPAIDQRVDDRLVGVGGVVGERPRGGAAPLENNAGRAPLWAPPAWGSYSSRRTFFSVGKSLGIGIVTLPVAAHSVLRCMVVMKPTQLMAAVSWPMGV